MNTYYSELGRILDGRIPLRKEGYFILHEGNQISYDTSVPADVAIVTATDFTHALVEGCKCILNTFSQRSENEQVYAFNLYADEQYSFYIYMNTNSSFLETLEEYEYTEPTEINALKYNPGDFSFQYWDTHMGEYGEVIKQFELIGDRASGDLSEFKRPDAIEGAPIVAFEIGIIKAGFNLLAVNAIQQLIAENAFNVLNKTDQFIAYVATGNALLDYSITMRKTIDSTMFYEVFPDIRESDQSYLEQLESYQKLNVSESLDYWMEAVHDSYASTFPYSLCKSEYEIFKQLERFGNPLAQESLKRLEGLVGKKELESEEYYEIDYYIECLYFSGSLTEAQKEKCRELAAIIQNNKALDNAYASPLWSLITNEPLLK
ncbi:DUF4303 domain-containing protein [Paenibacillus xylanexedens]|uniref:DUF4303 domain-containing protein n=1 Tax=Paenibacillus xylanexedens TaxID=528191 RepID=UPI0016431B14|nr:DUF4303 domain-containing protein [Paenibacillus xylanexedens]